MCGGLNIDSEYTTQTYTAWPDGTVTYAELVLEFQRGEYLGGDRGRQVVRGMGDR
ncbi:hypothetical protein GCM10023339_18790 [Alloalcanivorax gelatiniphagus]